MCSGALRRRVSASMGRVTHKRSTPHSSPLNNKHVFTVKPHRMCRMRPLLAPPTGRWQIRGESNLTGPQRKRNGVGLATLSPQGHTDSSSPAEPGLTVSMSCHGTSTPCMSGEPTWRCLCFTCSSCGNSEDPQPRSRVNPVALSSRIGLTEAPQKCHWIHWVVLFR